MPNFSRASNNDCDRVCSDIFKRFCSVRISSSRSTTSAFNCLISFWSSACSAASSRPRLSSWSLATNKSTKSVCSAAEIFRCFGAFVFSINSLEIIWIWNRMWWINLLKIVVGLLQLNGFVFYVLNVIYLLCDNFKVINYRLQHFCCISVFCHCKSPENRYQTITEDAQLFYRNILIYGYVWSVCGCFVYED